jgi:hypothetical protein
LLIAIGVIFLLSNIGILDTNGWETIWQFWPVILIVIGLDNLWQREGIVGATLLVGAGVIFLLSNFGMLALDPWQVLIRLWPLLLIAVGFDVVIGRRNVWASLIGAMIVLTILAGALWLFGLHVPAGGLLQSEEISQPLEDVSAARLRLEAGPGDFLLKALSDTKSLIAGKVSMAPGRRFNQEYEQQGNTAFYQLRESGVMIYLPRPRQTGWQWSLGVTPTIPLDLRTSLAVGNLSVDLSGLQISALDVNLGVGQANLILPQASDFDGKISAGIGNIVIVIPAGVGVQLDINAALVNVDLPAGQRGRNRYTSPDYDTADQKINLELNMAIGNLRIIER